MKLLKTELGLILSLIIGSFLLHKPFAWLVTAYNCFNQEECQIWGIGSNGILFILFTTLTLGWSLMYLIKIPLNRRGNKKYVNKFFAIVAFALYLMSLVYLFQYEYIVTTRNGLNAGSFIERFNADQPSKIRTEWDNINYVGLHLIPQGYKCTKWCNKPHPYILLKDGQGYRLPDMLGGERNRFIEYLVKEKNIQTSNFFF